MMDDLRTQVLVSDEALLFIAALAEVNLAGPDWLVSLLEKPWKWHREWELWHEHGMPSDPHSGEFQRFTEAVDTLT